MKDGGLPPQNHSEELTVLESAFDAMVAIDLECLSVAQLLDRACRLQKFSARIDADRATVLATADAASEDPAC